MEGKSEMKTLQLLIACTALVLMTPAYAAKKIYTEPEDRGYGIYVLKWPKPYAGEVFYYVDVNAELCFAAHYSGASSNMFEVDCSKLANREEWQEIITWVVPSNSN